MGWDRGVSGGWERSDEHIVDIGEQRGVHWVGIGKGWDGNMFGCPQHWAFLAHCTSRCDELMMSGAGRRLCVRMLQHLGL